MVEANGADTASLTTAEDTAAARAGVVAISNSYGGAEGQHRHRGRPALQHPGIAITASSGDSGYGVLWPASSPYVTAVGGTSLTRATNARGWTETAWSDSGSGRSAVEPKPARQHDAGCARRTVVDVSAEADPNTGVAVRQHRVDHVRLVALRNASKLFDVTSGANGSYLCPAGPGCGARPGWEHPTGRARSDPTGDP